jgi:hypothetical protein
MVLKVEHKDLIIFGVSIGSGVATSLCVGMGEWMPQALVLLSPYTSLRDVVGAQSCMCFSNCCLSTINFHSIGIID